MKKIFILKTLLLISLLIQGNTAFSANYTYTGTSIALGSTVGCAVTTYTFTQRTANNNNAKQTTPKTVTIVFPAGVNISTATMAGSTYKGAAITTGWSISGQTLTFQSPVNVGKDVSYSIVIANVTNGASISANASVSVVNNSGGTNSYTSYAIATTACPSVPANDNCGAPTTLTPPAAGSTTCTTTSGTTFGASASPQTVCSGQADDDVWYRFTANGATHQVTVTGVSGFNATVEVLSGTCGGTMTSLSCMNSTGSGGTETVNLTGLTSGTQYFVRVYHNGTGAGVLAANSFTICVTSSSSVLCSIGSGNLTAASLPYSSGSQTTCGAGNDITSSNVTNICGSSSYYGGEDKVIIFTPSTSGNVAINLTSSGTWVGIMLYNGCPTAGGTCVANAQGSAGNQAIGCAPVTAGTTYYLVVDSYPSPTCNPFSVTISAPTGGTPAGTVCSNAVAMTFPFSATGESTLCFGNDYSNASTGSPGSLYESGEDKVYKFTTTGSNCFNLLLSNASSDYIGYQVYSGCPGTAGTTCIANGGGATSGSLSASFTVPSAGTYYLVIDTWSAPSSVNYSIAVTSLGSGPSNDLPCNAQPLSLGSSVGGDNNCSGSGSEPAAASCWSTGTVNSVWYTAVVPASGTMKIRTTTGTLLNTQIAVYTGTCSSLTALACNDNATSCNSFTNYNSELSLTGLTVGSTLYISVDGSYATTGTFSILAIDGSQSFPSIPGQDCGDPNPVCNTVMSVSNPGYSGSGNNCDLPTSYCLASGERNVVWYRVPISAAGTLEFNIVPNDFVYTIEDETDYDFGVWKTAETGGTLGADYYNCTQIAAGTAPPVACDYSSLGVTGVNGTGTAPTSLATTVCPTCPGSYNPSATYTSAYKPAIDAVAGDEYLIAISNYTSSTSGFKINFTGTCTIDFAASLASAGGVTWSGGDASVPTLWTDVDNWGGCAAPTCTRDAYVSPFTNQPVLVSGQTYATRDVIIQAGATLTLQANSVLEVCGNFTNFGTINADPTSTILFKGSGTQTISGNLIGSNKTGNLTVTKLTGTVVLANDIEIGGTFTTSNLTSIFNSNSKLVKLGKDFSNYSGNVTYTTTGTTGTLNFNGSGTQTYNQGITQLDLNNVIMSNTAAAGSGVTLATNMFIKTGTGTLTLNSGTITTSTNRVDVAATAANAVSAGSAISYVDGNLRRYLASTGGYEWPVGNVSKGYQRATTTFTSNSIGYIDARFDVWPSTPPIQGGTECGMTYNYEAENNGYWTLTANSGTGTYNMTLYPLNATNTTGMSGWTIIKRPSLASGSWTVSGSCVASTATVVNRSGMSGFSVFGAAQSVTPLPIELLSFTGRNEGMSNYLQWVTATEINNDYFTLERSANGYDFTDFAVVDGAGNSSIELSYDKYDHTPYFGITYYRLRQTDFDGVESHSNVIALTNGLDEVSMGNVHPNPSSGDASFDFFSPVNGYIHIRLLDNTGRIVLDKVEQITLEQTKVNLLMNQLAKGVYSLEVFFDKTGFTSVVKVVKN